MRFESIEAYAFGSLRSASLELAPGMNVVHGANEAGKSTWHAALYAGLCGLRRGKGRAARADVQFERRHRPWDGDGGWEVGAVVELADGRRVALRHDLAGKVESSARDADIAGRDYSNEIVFEGAPDGSCWLGLNRASFLDTACVRQGQMLALRTGADALQGALQAAVDAAGTDATAARALELLSDYRRGAGWVRPARAPSRCSSGGAKWRPRARRWRPPARRATRTCGNVAGRLRSRRPSSRPAPGSMRRVRAIWRHRRSGRRHVLLRPVRCLAALPAVPPGRPTTTSLRTAWRPRSRCGPRGQRRGIRPVRRRLNSNGDARNWSASSIP